LEATDEKSKIQIKIRIRNPVYRSKDPDLSQNVTDPEHWFLFKAAKTLQPSVGVKQIPDTDLYRRWREGHERCGAGSCSPARPSCWPAAASAASAPNKQNLATNKKSIKFSLIPFLFIQIKSKIRKNAPRIYPKTNVADQE
jgi:hypothetical protein